MLFTGLFKVTSLFYRYLSACNACKGKTPPRFCRWVRVTSWAKSQNVQICLCLCNSNIAAVHGGRKRHCTQSYRQENTCPGASHPEQAALCSQPPGSSPFVLRPSLFLTLTGEGYTALRCLSLHLLIRLSLLEGRNMSSPSL